MTFSLEELEGIRRLRSSGYPDSAIATVVALARTMQLDLNKIVTLRQDIAFTLASMQR